MGDIMKEKKNIPEIRFKGFEGEWEEKRLGNLGSIAMNRRIYKYQTSEKGDIPFFKIGTFGSEPDAFISKSLFDDYKTRFPYPSIGDILISASGSIGRTIEYTGKDEYFQDSNIVWLQHNGNIENSFLKYFYSIVEWSGLEGSTIKRLYNKNILNTKISLPSKKEQSQIGTFFQNLDKQITLEQQKHDKLVTLKKAMLEKMFPKEGASVPEIRFEGFEGVWPKVILDEIVDLFKGKTLGWKDISDNGIYECILYGNLYTEYGMVINKVYYKTNNYSNELVLSKSGDVLIPSSDTTPTGLARASSIEKDGVILGGDINVLRPSKEINGSFISYNINANRDKLIKYIKGSTVRHLDNSDLKNVELYISKNPKEQSSIVNFFKKTDTLISLQQQKIDKLKNIKKACLDKMFV